MDATGTTAGGGSTDEAGRTEALPGTDALPGTEAGQRTDAGQRTGGGPRGRTRTDTGAPAAQVPPAGVDLPTSRTSPDVPGTSEAEAEAGNGKGGGAGPVVRRTADGSRLPSLTGLRFAAAFLVFGFHISICGLFAAGGAAHALDRAVGAGAVGVSFFFVLSGFVLTWSARPDDTARRFWRRRLVKIYPNYVLAWVLALAGLAAASLTPGVRAALLNLFLVQSWSPSPGTYFGVNSVSWSLSCEAFFYLLFPWLLRPLARLRPGRLLPAALALVAAVLLVPAAAELLPAGRRYWFVYVFPPVRLLEFALGMVTALMVRAGRWPRVPVSAATVLLVAAYAVTPYLPVNAEPVAATVIPFALLIPAVAAGDLAGRGTGLWRGPVAVWLGEISFAFYLVHQSVIVDLLRGLDARSSPPGRAAALTAAALALSVALAAALHRFVEQPAMRRFSRPRAGRHGQPGRGPAGRRRPGRGRPGHVQAERGRPGRTRAGRE